jgi:hypothetical protein
MINDYLKQTLKETAVGDFKVIFWHIPGSKGKSKIVPVLS